MLQGKCQYLCISVAFADVHEYGFYPYEYLPPPTNISTPAEKQLANMGMYSLRSFLYPKTFAVAMEIAILSNIPLTPFMVGWLSFKNTLSFIYNRTIVVCISDNSVLGVLEMLLLLLLC